ncbi:MAG TPA: hypothetical protein EYN91_26735 [Candidatus Melainabacteria bacterium]|jgi:hypothetical protein|nr:hypothetical protein [Candidatus Melainabacteria bacterium]
MRTLLAASLGITAALTLCMGTGAFAQDSVVVTRTITTTDPGVLIGTITTRREELNKLYADALAQNLMAEAEKNLLKAELDRIAAEEAAAKALTGVAASSKIVILARDIDTLGDRFNVVLKKPVFVPIVEGSHFTIVEGKVVELDDVAKRRWDLEGKINKLYLESKISASTANSLRSRMDLIATQEAGMRADGNLDLKEGRILYNEFDKIGSDLDSAAK